MPSNKTLDPMNQPTSQAIEAKIEIQYHQPALAFQNILNKKRDPDSVARVC